MSLPPANEKEAACVAHLKKNFASSMLAPEDADFLTPDTYLCFARAREGDEKKASAMLQAAIEWRKEYKPYAITSDDVGKAMEQHTVTCGGVCKEGRPVMVMGLGTLNECDVAERTKQLVYLMEETQRKGYYSITWIVDFGEMGKNKRDNRSKEARKETLKIMQDYYPERLGKMLLYRPPWYVRMLIGVFKLFVDARTAAKMYKAGNGIEGLEKYIARDQVPEQCGGTMPGNSLKHLTDLPPLGAAAKSKDVETRQEEAGDHAPADSQKEVAATA